jgi:hypothetical protein
MDKGVYQDCHSAKASLLRDVMQRYMEEVTPTKRGAQRESESIRFMQRSKMALHSMVLPLTEN